MDGQSPPSDGNQEFPCEICDIVCNGRASYEAHLIGTKHLRKSGATICVTCRIDCRTTTAYAEHLTSEAHRERLAVTEGEETPNNPFYCDTCKRDCESQASYESHIAGQKHNAALARHEASASTANFICDVCTIDCQSRPSYESHLTGQRHRHALEKRQRLESVDSTMASYFCEACCVSCDTLSIYESHLAGQKHKRKTAMAAEVRSECVYSINTFLLDVALSRLSSSLFIQVYSGWGKGELYMGCPKGRACSLQQPVGRLFCTITTLNDVPAGWRAAMYGLVTPRICLRESSPLSHTHYPLQYASMKEKGELCRIAIISLMRYAIISHLLTA